MPEELFYSRFELVNASGDVVFTGGIDCLGDITPELAMAVYHRSCGWLGNTPETDLELVDLGRYGVARPVDVSQY